MSTTPVFEEYKEAVKELFRIRIRNNSEDSEEEDVHLDKMDDIWYRMSDEDLKAARSNELSDSLEEEVKKELGVSP